MKMALTVGISLTVFYCQKNNEVVIDRFFFRFKGLLKDLIETEIPELKKAISIPDARPEAIMG